MAALIYVFLLIAMALLRFCLPEDNRRNRRIFCITCGCWLVLVSALRAPEVGRDTASFIDVFLKVEGRGFWDVLRFSSWTEPGFRLLCAFIGLFTKNGQWLIVVTSIIIHGSYTFFLYKHAKNPYLGLYLYVALMLYPFNFSMMRQALAVAVWLFAYGFLKRKKWIPYVLLVLLASTFHSSALLLLLCPLATLLPMTRKWLPLAAAIFGGGAVLGALFVRPLMKLAQLLLPRYADYEAFTFDALYYYCAFFVAVTAYGILRLYLSENGEEPQATGFDERSFLTWMMFSGVVVATMMTQFGELQRIFHYFEVLYLLWLPLAVPPAFAEGERRRLAFPLQEILVILVAAAYFAVILFLRSAIWYDALPYRFFWQ